ncbi:MAG: DedA family protein [Brevundimonas sp.]|uniref:DedA family protein n=1 Tax=Brevundimonas sp. TaxID=1871086 RepID=UPI0025B96E72|nr:DedA family protein [Brevundimonas sp.]MBX3477739.1 DedA family protein [Brevundimonas sp.]
MEHLASDIGAFIARNAVWGGPLLGLITFGESMVVIGAFFPATALMLVAGGLVAAGVLDGPTVLAWCIAGAVLGDAVSYVLGRRFGGRIWRVAALKPHRTIMARARLFFRRYGVASIYLCRFMGPVRAFVPLIAGATGMAHLRFQLANLGSAVIWVPVMLAPGYLAGKGARMIGGEHALEWALGGLAAAAALALVLHALRQRRASRPDPSLDALEDPQA